HGATILNLREQMGLDGALSSVHPGKRHDRLLEAYAQSGIDAPLVLLGQGKPEQEQRLRQLAKTLHIDERVWFKGVQKNPLPWIK
ncbi:hypothetical protein Q6243_27520, partial [Klebsiella pneumoniae]|nr:hypothetical protein [Klebsiella pneumoniae]